MLEWGHGPKAVETATAGISTAMKLRASMGPRPEGRGDARSVVRIAAAVAGLQWGHGPKAVETARGAAWGAERKWASMGPRPEGRGDLDPSVYDADYEKLQWGHGPKAVETWLPHM